MNGKCIVEAAFSDVESFFIEGSTFQVNRELDVDAIQYASIKGSGVGARIRVSRSICEYEIKKIEDYLFVLTIICHELAHYLNFHNEHVDREELDSIALESRADHFGAQILLVLVTFNMNTRRLIETIEPVLEEKLMIRSLGKAFGDIYREIYLPGCLELYPKPNLRVGLTVAGCLSFFHRLFSGLPKEFSINFILIIIQEGGLACAFLNLDDSNQEEVVERIIQTHSALQQEQPFMNKGFKAKFGSLLTSQFNASPNRRQSHRGSLEAHVQNFLN